MKCLNCGYETENKKSMSNHRRYGCGLLDESKRCNKCGISKPLEFFSNNKRDRDGKHNWCKDCASKKNREWYLRNPDYNRSPYAKQQRAEWYQKNKKEVHIKRRKQYAQRKINALAHYAGGTYPHCIICGIDDIDVLCLDHINGGGTKERAMTNRKDIHRLLWSKSYPEGYQTLCANCNLKKEILERRKRDATAP